MTDPLEKSRCLGPNESFKGLGLGFMRGPASRQAVNLPSQRGHNHISYLVIESLKVCPKMNRGERDRRVRRARVDMIIKDRTTWTLSEPVVVV